MSCRVFVLFYLTSICIRAAETSQVTFNRDSGGQRAADQFRDEVFCYNIERRGGLSRSRSPPSDVPGATVLFGSNGAEERLSQRGRGNEIDRLYFDWGMGFSQVSLSIRWPVPQSGF
jgi:hypothetical protein